MRVLLRDAKTGRYYAGPDHWANDRDQAVDLQEIERAIQFNIEQKVGATDLILAYERPQCVLTVPIRL